MFPLTWHPSLPHFFVLIWPFMPRRAVLLWCKHSLNIQRALKCQVKDMVSLSLMAIMLCVSVSVWQDVSQERLEQLWGRIQVDGSQHNSTSINDALENRRGEGLKINIKLNSSKMYSKIVMRWNFGNRIKYKFLGLAETKSLTEMVMFH